MKPKKQKYRCLECKKEISQDTYHLYFGLCLDCHLEENITTNKIFNIENYDFCEIYI